MDAGLPSEENYTAPGCAPQTFVCSNDGTLLCALRSLQAQHDACRLTVECVAAPLSARMFWLGLRSRVGSRRMRRGAFLRLILTPGIESGPEVTIERLAALFGHDLADRPPVVSAQLRAMRQADATTRTGPSGSTIAGTRLLGLMAKNLAVNCSPFSASTGMSR